MGRDKKSGPGVRPGYHAKERHKKNARDLNSAGLLQPVSARVAVPGVPNLKPKHLTYYELVENKDKKKKLEYQVGLIPLPPPP